MKIRCGECDKEHTVWWFDPDIGIFVNCSCLGYDEMFMAYREGDE